MRVWRNKKTGKRYHKYDFSMVRYRKGKTVRGSTTGLAKFRNKRTKSGYDDKWAGR